MLISGWHYKLVMTDGFEPSFRLYHQRCTRHSDLPMLIYFVGCGSTSIRSGGNLLNFWEMSRDWSSFSVSQLGGQNNQPDAEFIGNCIAGRNDSGQQHAPSLSHRLSTALWIRLLAQRCSAGFRLLRIPGGPGSLMKLANFFWMQVICPKLETRAVKNPHVP